MGWVATCLGKKNLRGKLEFLKQCVSFCTSTSVWSRQVEAGDKCLPLGFPSLLLCHCVFCVLVVFFPEKGTKGN